MHRVLVHKQGKIQSGTISDLKSRNTVWVDMTDPNEEELAELEKHTDIETKQIRDWMIGKKHPSALDFHKYSVLIFLAPSTELPKSGNRLISAEPCVILVSNDRNDFVTIHKHPLRAIHDIEEYSEKHKIDIFAQRATFLLFTFLNEMVEHYYDALDFINETVQKAESLALNVHPERNLIHQILLVKKSIIYFHRALIANREVITTIEQEHLGFLDEEMLREFRVFSSAITQLIEINSTYREILNTSTEIHLAAISNNLNTTMKKVTSWGAIILVPSLIAGIFGMNFKHFPAFEWQHGPLFSLIAMIVSVGVLYWFFQKRDWL